MPGEKHPLHMPSQRPPHDGLQPDIPILARSKPSVNRIQLSLPLETEQGRERQGRFDQLLAQNFRKGVQPSDLGSEKEDKKGKKKDWEDEEESNKPLSRITLKGDLVPDQTNYCVGYFKDGTSLQVHTDCSAESEALCRSPTPCASFIRHSDEAGPYIPRSNSSNGPSS